MMSLRSALSRRAFSGCASLLNKSKVLPSSPEMKSQEAWSESNGDDSFITKTVVGMARNIQETSKPPVNVHKFYNSKFEFGQTYDPFDYSTTKMAMNNKAKLKKRPSLLNYDNGAHDPFVKAGLNPLDLYMMPEVLSRFVSSTGQILPRDRTRCNAVNQKKLSIAIKRARVSGLLSTVHKHNRFTPHRVL
ncbi:hypothetical protein ACI3LY_002692 [Candidozyma auris]|uniref:Small ribosomal subunit protein bS18m n=2 Tax=Candidozyma auris TaxID=498019 RepID=A0A2H0ZMB9_CANAR|nr:ribosomal_protein_S18 [[Candida] auris]PIS51785.1 ribosomal protein S18 [[Candida] auris]PIS53773.1 ribosomal protein S18 [[Candida] auris]QEL58673.1 ribosomal protein S18 [[Candida] auris]QEO21086.1 ribosomal_protein_S18 [[Candida] auris]QRG36856.1 ribosomal protein S18 [[Candida] auris]